MPVKERRQGFEAKMNADREERTTPARSVLVIRCPTNITVTRGSVNSARYVNTTGPPSLKRRRVSSKNLSNIFSVLNVRCPATTLTFLRRGLSKFYSIRTVYVFNEMYNMN